MHSSAAEPGRVLVDRYRLDEIIGTGGMGRVWQGTDTLLDRAVAIKELTAPPGLPEHEVDVLRTRMIREARSAAQLSHPSIITVFDVADDGRPWIVMELVRGPSLGTLLDDEGALPVHRAAEIGEQTAAGLAEAHRRGIVHRDIKPGNVLIAGDDRVVLTDFGIARLDGSTHLTSTGLLIGSPSYLAPEVAHGYAATPASDIWALGVTLYQAVEGELPFERSTPMATLTAIVTQELPEPSRGGPLAALLARMCAKEPEDRPSAERVRAELRKIREGTEQGAVSAGPVSPTRTSGTPAAFGAFATEPGPWPSSSAAPETASEAGSETAGSGPDTGTGTGGPEPVEAAARSGPGAPTGTAGTGRPDDGRRSRRTRLLVAGALVLALLTAGTVSALVSMDRGDGQLVGDGEQVGASEGASDPGEDDENGADDGGEDAPGDEASEQGRDEDGAGGEDGGDPGDGPDDEDWDFLDRHEDESGFAVEVPEGWEHRQEEHMVYFDNPDGGYLLIDQTDDPNDDAAEDWRDLEPRARGNFDGYSLVGIEEVDADWADAYESAADWEFTYSDGDMHGINRGFHTEDKGYALLFVSPEDPSVNHQVLDRISETFEPAS